MTVSRRAVLQGGLALLLAGCSGPPSGPIPPPDRGAIRAATFNIRFLDLTERGRDGPRGPAAWIERRRLVLAALERIDADLIGFQEMESWDGRPQTDPPVQRDWLSAAMRGHGVAAARHGPHDTGQAIFYRHRRFVLLDQGCEDIGAAPGLPRAFAGYADRVTWARLRDRLTGQGLTVVNLHLHVSDGLLRDSGARVARTLLEAAQARGDLVVALGDFNVGRNARPLRILEEAGLRVVPSQGASFHFNAGIELYPAIDHILHGPGLRADGPARIFRGQSQGVWPSDHYPVWADLRPTGPEDVTGSAA